MLTVSPASLPVALTPTEKYATQLQRASRLYLGQTVTGAGIAAGTTVAAISAVDGSGNFTVLLSKNAVASSTAAAITFGGPGRNVVQFNNRGIVLTEGDAVVTNSDVRSNVNSGIELGVDLSKLPSTRYSIGTSMTRGANSNAIYDNGGWAVLLSPTIEQRISDDRMLKKVSPIQIQGNFFDGAARSTSAVANRRGVVGKGLADKAALQVAAEFARTGLNYVNPNKPTETTVDEYGNQYLRAGSSVNPPGPPTGGTGGTVTTPNPPNAVTPNAGNGGTVPQARPRI
jgi:hypothetical protein